MGAVAEVGDCVSPRLRSAQMACLATGRCPAWLTVEPSLLQPWPLQAWLSLPPPPPTLHQGSSWHTGEGRGPGEGVAVEFCSAIAE